MNKKPDWLRTKALSEPFLETYKLLQAHDIHTICKEAACPNMSECFAAKTATFLILGDSCTRNCRYCNVLHKKPLAIDADEPKKIAKAVRELGLRYVVITSVTRDDLPDGGAGIFVDVIKEVRKLGNDIKVEILTPDFEDSLISVLDAQPDVFGHNLETVKELFSKVRPQGNYDKSLRLLKKIKFHNPKQITKSGIMIGLGESETQIIATINDLKSAGIDILTIGQYLQPNKNCIPVSRYYEPELFKKFEKIAKDMGIAHVFAGPMVRSSYHASTIFSDA